MAGSMWQQYYDPQITARNRWVEHSSVRPVDLAPRSARRSPAGLQVRGSGIRARLAAVGAAAGSVLIAVLAVLGMHVFRGEPQSAGAPPAAVVHSAPDAATGHGIGG
jgi:hypothetical protein